MSLKILRHNVKKIKLCDMSAYEDETLYVDIEKLKKICLEGINGYELNFYVAIPGEKTRIIHITDVVKPSHKENASTFPGWLPGESKSGEGETHQIEGLSIMQCCTFSGIQEGIVDMWGNGAKFSQFSSKINLVMEVNIVDKNMTNEILAHDLIMMNLRAADYLASICTDSVPNNEETFEIRDFSELPKIGYTYFIQAQGNLRNVHLGGQNCVEMSPVSLNPCKLIDGELISGNYIIACQKNPTYFHQENPVILDLFARDGKELSFGGVIISTESNLNDSKKNNARIIADIAKQNKFDGIIVTQEGGGHADVDLMMTLDACVENGIAVVLQTNEIAGPGGDLPPLVCYSKHADAIVTNGNNDEIIDLEAADTVIGGESILNGKFNPYEAFSTNLGIMYTSTNQLGANYMTTLEY